MPEKVKMNLIGVDGNAFALLGAFRREARRAGWEREEIDAVANEAMSSDYNHLLVTLMNNIEGPDSDDE